MHLKINRFLTTDKSTVGTLLIDGNFQCYTLEDPHHDVKIPGETRIPAGIYTLGLRKVGGFHQRYKHTFGCDHFGMIEVKDVPGFEYILMHIGNWPRDTEGCILVGQAAGRDSISNSTSAYKAMYSIVGRALFDHKEVTLEIS